MIKEKLNEFPDYIIHIYATELESISDTEMQDAIEESSKSIEEIASNLSAYCEEYGKERVLKEILPIETELILSNEQTQTHGKHSCISHA